MRTIYKIAVAVVIFCIVLAATVASLQATVLTTKEHNCTNCVVNVTKLANTTNVTANATKQVKKPVFTILYFWEPNCPYCAQMKPTIDQFNATQINIFEHPEAVKQYDLKVTPTTIIFKDGKQVARLENVHSAEEISKILNS